MITIRHLFFRLLSVFRSGPAEPLQDKLPSAAEQAKESTPAARRWARDSWWLDVKLGVRMLVKYPGLALAGGAGIAVVVAIAAGAYSFIYTNLLVSSLPLEEGDRIVSIEIWDPAAGRPEPRSQYDYHVWREGLKSVQEISAFRILAPNLIAAGAQPESVRVAAMSAAGFRVARVRPLMGRYLEDEDEREGAPPVIVIGENVWRNRFLGDHAILGRTIQLGATPYSIVGVMPKGFAFPVNDRFWVPLRLGLPPPEPRMGLDLMVFGRLAPGATLTGAQAELAVIGQHTALAFPKIYAQLRPQVLPYAHPFVGLHGAQDLTNLFKTQGLLVSMLVLVCLNVAILVYTRTAMRQAEIGVRTALGASRGRIVTQLFIEALVLSAVAALAGVAIAALGLHQVATAMLDIASELPFWMSFRFLPEAVLYAVVLSVFAAAIVGIVPALQATRRGLQTGPRVAGAGGMILGKTWTILIIAQVTFAVAILPPAISSAWEDTQDGIAGLGFAAERFLSAQLSMESVTGTGTTVASDTAEFPRRFAGRQTELMRRLEAEPRVSSVTFAMFNPGDEGNARMEAEGAAFPSQSELGLSGSAIRRENEVYEVRFNRVDVNFFRVFEVPILGGRGFEPADIASRPSLQSEDWPDGGAVVVNQPLAQRIFGGNALGRRVRYVNSSGGTAEQSAAPGHWYEIVGVVSDFPTGVSQGMRDTKDKMYHAVAPGQLQPAAIAIRLRHGTPSTFTQRLREIALTVHSDLSLRKVRSLDEALRSEQWISRLTAAMFVGITVSVLMLSSAGIYALMSFTVSQRRKEIGIRMALGADWKRIVASLFSRAFLQLAAGAAFGVALGVVLERGSGGVIMRGNMAVVLPAVAVVMIAVGFLATLGPALRSLRIEPTEALREE